MTTQVVKEVEGDTNIFIYPGYKFKCIDCLITNFHLPESTLIMLVSTLAGKDFVMAAYEEAVRDMFHPHHAWAVELIKERKENQETQEMLK